MKATIDIADALLDQAKRAAERENTTLRALVERGLRQVLASPAQDSAPFRLRRVTLVADLVAFVHRSALGRRRGAGGARPAHRSDAARRQLGDGRRRRAGATR